MSDPRRFLHDHLMTCRNCVAEVKIFCSDVAKAGAEYRELVSDKPEMHDDFIRVVIVWRMKKFMRELGPRNAF